VVKKLHFDHNVMNATEVQMIKPKGFDYPKIFLNPCAEFLILSTDDEG
jgi:hypothetical protein